MANSFDIWEEMFVVATAARVRCWHCILTFIWTMITFWILEFDLICTLPGIIQAMFSMLLLLLLLFIHDSCTLLHKSTCDTECVLLMQCVIDQSSQTCVAMLISMQPSEATKNISIQWTIFLLLYIVRLSVCDWTLMSFTIKRSLRR